MSCYGFEESLGNKFRMHNISGAIVKDLQFGDLKELGVQFFGQRHRLWNEIRNLGANPCYTANSARRSLPPTTTQPAAISSRAALNRATITKAAPLLQGRKLSQVAEAATQTGRSCKETPWSWSDCEMQPDLRVRLQSNKVRNFSH